MDALRQPAVRHIAIANPAHAPYGRAAEAALRSLGLYDAVKDKLVMGENISQTFQMAQSGAAEVGIVALSLAIAPAACRPGPLLGSAARRLSAHPAGRRDHEVDQESGSRAGLPRIPARARRPRYPEAIWILGRLNGVASPLAEPAPIVLDHADPAGHRAARRALADVLAAPLEVPGGSRGGAAAGAAAHRAGILYPAGHRPAQSGGALVRGAHRRHAAVLVSRAAGGLRAL